MKLEGIHHITAITGDAPRNLDFYTRVMGLRLTAKTVNQDDPTVYHLFYADEQGSPGSILTWFEFPKWFERKEPVNQPTAPQSTPGGLSSQRSSIGHYELADDEALIVTVPECTDCAYQAIQIGSDWYASTDYETHQTSLTKAQAVTDPDGVMRFVISERDPGIANWLETTGHRTGAMMLRWQRLERDLGPDDGPTVAVVPFAEVHDHLPHHAAVTPEEYAARIAARQRAVARRMIS